MPSLRTRSNNSTGGVRLPMPHAGQEVVLRSPARFRWLDAGRRWNKTTLDLHVAVESALAGQEVMWGAPTYDQVRIGWNEMRWAAGGVAEFHETRLEARFHQTGGLVRFRSLDDPDNARGFTADTVIIDEAAKVPEAAWYEILRPMLMTTHGRALVNGTPNGRNWFWRECIRAQDGAATESAAWIEVPTLGATIEDGALIRRRHPMENPRIPWSELVNMFETLPERVFRQEILAEFLEDGGGVFRNVDGCVDQSLKLLTEPTHPTRQYVMGVDLAKHADFTVCVVMDILSRQVVAFDRFNRADWPLQKARILLMAKLFNNCLTFIDATGLGDPIYDDLRAAGLRIHPYKFTASTKEQLINHAVLLVEQQQIHYPAIPQLLSELKALEYSRSPSGGLRMAAPEGMHDDAAMAFCLCCWGLAHGGGFSLPSSVMEQLQGGGLGRLSDFHGADLRGKVF